MNMSQKYAALTSKTARVVFKILQKKSETMKAEELHEFASCECEGFFTRDIVSIFSEAHALAAEPKTGKQFYADDYAKKIIIVSASNNIDDYFLMNSIEPKIELAGEAGEGKSSVNVYLTNSQKEKLKILGGSKWIREQIESAKTKKDTR